MRSLRTEGIKSDVARGDHDFFIAFLNSPSKITRVDLQWRQEKLPNIFLRISGIFQTLKSILIQFQPIRFNPRLSKLVNFNYCNLYDSSQLIRQSPLKGGRRWFTTTLLHVVPRENKISPKGSVSTITRASSREVYRQLSFGNPAGISRSDSTQPRGLTTNEITGCIRQECLVLAPVAINSRFS